MTLRRNFIAALSMGMASVCIALYFALITGAAGVDERAPAARPRFVMYTRVFRDAPFIQ